MNELKESVAQIKLKLKENYEIGLIFGSGLGGLADEFENSCSINFREIPNFPQSKVEGHRGELVGGTLSGVKVIAMAGRVHYYEGLSMKEIGFPVRVLAECGIKKLIVTNAAGAVNKDFTPGDIVLIKDHINLMGDNPLIGAPDFQDMTYAYNPLLKKTAAEVAASLEIKLKEGVYLAMSGPSYETPAEINMAKIMGADMVGMSTVPEVIVANSMGLEVLGLSMVTNMAAGITGEKLSHQEVIETTSVAQEKFKTLVKEVISKL